jgi:hypothetical protein
MLVRKECIRGLFSLALWGSSFYVATHQVAVIQNRIHETS